MEKVSPSFSSSSSYPFHELADQVKGEVCYDRLTRQIYSVDASIYQIYPQCVVFPKSTKDVVVTLQFASQYQIPVTARGAATGITGGCLGEGIILDFSRYMNRILEINIQEGYAWVEPGVVQDQLNLALKKHKYLFGPDTSTGNRATIGGMFGNNSSGAHSLRYGKTSDNILEVEMVFADASVEIIGYNHAQTSSKVQHWFQQIRTIAETRRQAIQTRFPKIQRNVSGYALDLVLQGPSFNLAQFLTGSEGTLGIATKLKVKIVPGPLYTGLVVLHFEDMFEGSRTIPDILSSDPYSIELMDDCLIGLGKKNPLFKGQLQWLHGNPKMILVVEFEANKEEELNQKIRNFCQTNPAVFRAYTYEVVTDSSTISEIWLLRKAGLGIIMSQRTPEKAIAFLEDTAVPPEKLADYLIQFNGMLERVGKPAAYYGHAGVGLVHIRPFLNLANPQEAKLMVQMMEEISSVLLEYGGSISGEHGDGLIRSWLIEKMYGPEIYQAFGEIKQLFDPKNLLNPGKIVNPRSPLENFRHNLTTCQTEVSFPTGFDFSRLGGLVFAAGMCNGDANCRQISGQMCPSFQVTGEEIHSTRARATALIEALLDPEPLSCLTSQDLYKVMEFCVQCKGCQTECPSQVDIARMKSEFLYHYQKVHGIPLRNRIFANIDQLNYLGSWMPRLTNWINSSSIAKAIFERIGITSKRQFPTLASLPFSKWYQQNRYRYPNYQEGDKVALFVDTFAEYNYPHIAQDAYKVLHALKCNVIIPPYACCGRPAISKGLLDLARKKAQKVAQIYLPLIEQGYRIVGLEPSCIATLQDEYRYLLPAPDGDRIAMASLSIEEYLYERLQKKTLLLPWQPREQRIHIHIHCHQKASAGTIPALAVLKAIPNLHVHFINSGCCGVAGTFGYEKEHYEFSIRIGELALLPIVRGIPHDHTIIASGLSCRSQIEHNTPHRPLHFIQFIASLLPQ